MIFDKKYNHRDSVIEDLVWVCVKCINSSSVFNYQHCIRISLVLAEMT